MSNPINQNRGLLFATLTAILWGFLAIALKVAVEDIDAITVSWFRFLIAFIALLFFINTKKESHLGQLKIFPWLAIVAAIGLTLNYIGFIKGIALTSPTNAQIIIQFGPLLLGAIGIIAFKEKITLIQVAGFLIALFGFWFFYRDRLSTTDETDATTYTMGSVYIFLSAFCWVAYAVCQKILVRKYAIGVINLILFGFASIVLIPWVDFQSILNMSLGMWILMLFLGLNTLLAYSFLGEAFKYADANKVGIIITLNPLITISTMALLSMMDVSWIESEVLSTNALIGALTVIAGAIIAVKSK